MWIDIFLKCGRILFKNVDGYCLKSVAGCCLKMWMSIVKNVDEYCLKMWMYIVLKMWMDIILKCG